MSALDDIAAERNRQIDVEHWTPAHDDMHNAGELACAAGCYAIGSSLAGERDRVFTRYWPWHKLWWKPGDARRMLVKAGALIVAEIERLDRRTGRSMEEESLRERGDLMHKPAEH
jgi:hypothetical protein